MAQPALSSEKKKSPVALIVLVLVAILAVVGIAWYQEQIYYYFTLQGWDKAAPARSVSEFLTAGLNGDKARAESYLGSDSFKPLEKNGKWVGYSITTMAGTLEYHFKELAAGPNPQPTATEFTYTGKGAATVTLPDTKGKPVRYRLERAGGQWRITEILGGRMAS
jgi:hypothetical protein